MADDNLRALGNYARALARHLPKAIWSNTENEIQKTSAALESSILRLSRGAKESLRRTNAAEMAYLASLTYGFERTGRAAIADILSTGASPLTKPYTSVCELSSPYHNVQKTEPSGFVTESSEGVVIALKGSSNLFDWAINSCFISAVSAGVHEGYTAMGTWVCKELIEQFSLEDLRKKKSFIITGHSLGGAVALVAGWAIARLVGCGQPQTPHIEVYSFGAPHVGGTEERPHPFALSVPEYRFSTAADLVAGFGDLDQNPPTYLIGSGLQIYEFDDSREAKLIRLFEIVKTAYAKNAMPSAILKLILMQIRDASSSDKALEQDIILSMEPKNFPPTVCVPEHSIGRYLSALIAQAS